MLDQLAAYIIHSPALRVFVAVVVAANLLTVSYVNMMKCDTVGLHRYRNSSEVSSSIVSFVIKLVL
jgi:hypothetical protein